MEISHQIPWSTIGVVISWYTSNIGVLLLNKYLLTNYGYAYPIFLTLCHMTACSFLSYIAVSIMDVVPFQTIQSKAQFFKICGLSVVFCFSVVCGNMSLKYIPVSFNQAIGATTPFFTAVFAYAVSGKREAWVTYGTLLPVVAGVVIASGGEPSFHLFGFIICASSTAARAFKSVLQDILLSSEGEKLNSMNLLMYMAPIAMVVLLPAALLMEENVIWMTIELARNDITVVWYLFFSSSLAFFVNLTNFLVTKHTSALTLQDSLHPLTLFVDKERNRVIVAEASADFVDILFSFLTLPLGTIIRLISNEKNDQNVEIGCINNLYKSVENLDTQVFWNEICKEMLLRPRNPCETLCQKLKYKVDDTEPTKYFMCGSCRARNDFLLSTFAGANCSYCGKPMDKEMKLQEENHAKDDGVFVKGSTMYLIFDDLKVLPSSPANSVQQLTQLGYTDFTKLKPITLATGGGSKILEILKRALISKTVLTDVFLVDYEEGGYNSQPVCSFTPNYEPSQPTRWHYDDVCKFKVTVSKSKNRILYAEAEGDHFDFLFSILTTPIGSVIKHLDGKISLGSMENLYKSMKGMNSSWFTELTRDALLDLKVAPQYGCKWQALQLREVEIANYWYGTGVIRNMICYAETNGVVSKNKNVIESPKLMKLYDPRCADGRIVYGKGFVRRPSIFVVTDDLQVTSLTSVSSLSFLQKLNVPFHDLEKHEVNIEYIEALNLLGASLTSKTALTNGLFHLLVKKPKDEATL